MAHLQATGRASRVYRHPLAMVCRLIEAGQHEEIGINRLEAIRRWLRELGLTPMAGTTDAVPRHDHDEPKTGKARILSLIARKAASG